MEAEESRLSLPRIQAYKNQPTIHHPYSSAVHTDDAAVGVAVWSWVPVQLGDCAMTVL